MTSARIANLAAITLLAAASCLTNQTPAQAMSVYKWKNRPLLVFAPALTDPRLVRQMAIASAAASGLKDRDMVLITVVGDQVKTQFGRPPGRSAQSLRKRYAIGRNEFQALLIGKDGGVKARSSSPLTTGRLFPLIDAMPMRRQEMRENAR